MDEQQSRGGTMRTDQELLDLIRQKRDELGATTEEVRAIIVISDNERQNEEIGRDATNILRGMQTVVNEVYKINPVLEAIQALIAEVQKLIDLVGGYVLASYEADSVRKAKQEEVLVRMGLKKPKTK